MELPNHKQTDLEKTITEKAPKKIDKKYVWMSFKDVFDKSFNGSLKEVGKDSSLYSVSLEKIWVLNTKVEPLFLVLKADFWYVCRLKDSSTKHYMDLLAFAKRSKTAEEEIVFKWAEEMIYYDIFNRALLYVDQLDAFEKSIVRGEDV